MELQLVEIPRVRAREQAAEYRRAAKRITDPRQRREFEEIARAYRIASRDEVALIALTPTIRDGGTVTRTLVSGRGENERREHFLLPALAVCRASAAFVYTKGIREDGSVELVDSLFRASNYRAGRFMLEKIGELPEGYRAGWDLVGNWSGEAWRAMVPIVPPKHRPAGGDSLASYAVLWEVDEWAWCEVPRPPGDPALLRHVGADIYAVLAVWDLTELERLVLAGRRPE